MSVISISVISPVRISVISVVSVSVGMSVISISVISPVRISVISVVPRFRVGFGLGIGLGSGFSISFHNMNSSTRVSVVCVGMGISDWGGVSHGVGIMGSVRIVIVWVISTVEQCGCCCGFSCGSFGSLFIGATGYPFQVTVVTLGHGTIGHLLLFGITFPPVSVGISIISSIISSPATIAIVASIRMSVISVVPGFSIGFGLGIGLRYRIGCGKSRSDKQK